MSKRDKKIMILNPDQREALTQSPARLEVMDAMSEIAPCSVAELARELGRSPQSLYYHVEIMLNVGLLRQSGSRKAGRRDEAMYDLVSDHFRLAGSADTDEDKRRTLLRFNSTVVKLTERNYRDALALGLARRVGDRENIYLRRQRGRLSDEDLERFYELLEEIGALFAANSPTSTDAKRSRSAAKDATRPYGFTIALVPLNEHPDDGSKAADPTPAAKPRLRRKRSS